MADLGITDVYGEGYSPVGTGIRVSLRNPAQDVLIFHHERPLPRDFVDFAEQQGSRVVYQEVRENEIFRHIALGPDMAIHFYGQQLRLFASDAVMNEAIRRLHVREEEYPTRDWTRLDPKGQKLRAATFSLDYAAEYPEGDLPRTILARLGDKAALTIIDRIDKLAPEAARQIWQRDVAVKIYAGTAFGNVKIYGEDFSGTGDSAFFVGDPNGVKTLCKIAKECKADTVLLGKVSDGRFVEMPYE